MDFKRGDKLRLRVGGTATKILVRLLSRGTDPNEPIGIVGGIVDVPKDRTVEIDLNTNFNDVVQISVHGGSNPWGLYSLGQGNGPATLLSCEYSTIAY